MANHKVSFQRSSRESSEEADENDSDYELNQQTSRLEIAEYKTVRQ